MFIKVYNKLINEPMVQARIVNTQTVEFNDWCMRMANGSTVTAADVAAVMQQIEDKLPEILSLNAKVICSPGGLTFRPKVSGTLTQSELKKKLEARLAADPTLDIDVNREISTSDLAVSDCDLTIQVDLPQDWNDTFKKRTTLKRVSKATTSETNGSETTGGTETGGDNTGGGSTDNGGGTNNGGTNNGGTNNGGTDNGGDNGGGGTLIDDGE